MPTQTTPALNQADKFDSVGSTPPVGINCNPAPGVLPAPTWVSITGAGFTSDGVKCYPNTLSGGECQSHIVQTFAPSNPTPWALEYEVDVITPTTAWPPTAGQSWVQGLAFLVGSSGRDGITFTVHRNTTGPAAFWRLTLRGATSATDSIIGSGSFPALSFSQTFRLAARVTFTNASSISVLLLIDGSQFLFTSITLAAFNLATGNIGSDFTLVAKLCGLFSDIDGTNTGYFDRLRLRDIGSGAAQTDSYPAPTLTAALNLTPISVSDENDATGDALTVQPDRPSIPADQFRTIETRYDSGHVQSVATQSVRRTRWPMTWARVTETDRNTVVALHAATTGRKKAFTWADPETATTILLKFVAPMQSRMIDRGGSAGVRLYALSTEVEEAMA